MILQKQNVLLGYFDQGTWFNGEVQPPSFEAPGILPVMDLYLFQSIIEAKSFYDIYYKIIDFNNSAWCSIGEHWEKDQIGKILSCYKLAKVHACFYNDYKGNSLSITIACIKQKNEFMYIKKKQYLL